MKNILYWLIPLIITIALVVWIATLPKKSDDDLISKNGIHWHSSISIEIDGEKIGIPAGIGLGAVHNPMHTHEDDGTVHMEYGGIVRNEDVEIKRFFDVWKQDFSADSLMGNENGSLQMFVNREENFEFEKYKMRDGDDIKIVYKSSLEIEQ